MKHVLKFIVTEFKDTFQGWRGDSSENILAELDTYEDAEKWIELFYIKCNHRARLQIQKVYQHKDRVD